MMERQGSWAIPTEHDGATSGPVTLWSGESIDPGVPWPPLPFYGAPLQQDPSGFDQADAEGLISVAWRQVSAMNQSRRFGVPVSWTGLLHWIASKAASTERGQRFESVGFKRALKQGGVSWVRMLQNEQGDREKVLLKEVWACLGCEDTQMQGKFRNLMTKDEGFAQTFGRILEYLLHNLEKGPDEFRQASRRCAEVIEDWREQRPDSERLAWTHSLPNLYGALSTEERRTQQAVRRQQHEEREEHVRLRRAGPEEAETPDLTAPQPPASVVPVPARPQSPPPSQNLPPMAFGIRVGSDASGSGDQDRAQPQRRRGSKGGEKGQGAAPKGKSSRKGNEDPPKGGKGVARRGTTRTGGSDNRHERSVRPRQFQ